MKKRTDLSESMLYIYRSLAICVLITTAIVSVYSAVREYERNASATIANHAATKLNSAAIKKIRDRVYIAEIKLARNRIR